MTTSSKTQAKHTPEPWKHDADLGCKRIVGGKAGTSRQAKYQEIAYTVGLSDSARDMANADRIVLCVNACAPDGAVTRALQTIESAAGADGWPKGWGLVQEEVRAALALLRGEQP